MLPPLRAATINTMAASTTTTTGTPTLPAMEGTLFTYYRDEYVNRVAFRSGNPAHKRHVVLIGGLGDGASELCMGDVWALVSRPNPVRNT